MPSLRTAVLLGLAASAVACAPSTFEGLMGGEEQKAASPPAEPTDNNPHKTDKAVSDPSLLAPRPVAPLSVTWVNTLKPKFRWSLDNAPGATGAVVELSNTRDFKEVRHRWNATGSELVAPEALTPGIWFWRLTGRTIGTEGPASRVVWEVLVRGPSASGVASDAPMGGMLDVNGDGLPDLAMTFEGTPYEPGEPNWIGGVTFLGHPDGTYTIDQNSGVEWWADNLDANITGGTDLDGDGFADTAVSELVQWDEDPNSKSGGIFIWHGGDKGYNDEKDNNFELNYVRAPISPVPASIQAAGDVNGDGYGDLALQYPNLGFASLGSAHGSTSMMVFADDEDPVPNLALANAIDFDADGMSDIVMASTVASSPFRFARGARDRFTPLATLTLSTPKIPTRATAITSGDFDGDGVIEIAFATAIDGLPAVCTYTPNKGSLTQDNCWVGTGTAADVPTSLVAGDFEGDGTDELVVAGKAGVMTLKRNASKGFDATPIAGAFGTRVTMLHPGRGEGIWKDARWAVLGADGKSFHIYKNTTSVQQLNITGNKFLLNLGPSIR